METNTNSRRRDPDPRPIPTLLWALALGAGLAGCASTGEQAAFVAWDREPAPVTGARPGEPAPAPPDLGADPSLADYLAVARFRNRAVSSARHEWKAALERVPQARALPDPVLTYGVSLQSVETRVGAQGPRAGLTQAFPWFGTLGLKADVALTEAEVARQRYRDTLREVERDVALAYAEYHYLGAAIGITRDNMDLLAGWEGILRARYTTGGVAYSDLIKVQVELGRLEDRLTTLERLRDPHMARLRALLDLSRDTMLPWPGLLPSPRPLAPVEELQDRLLRDNTELEVLAAQIEGEAHRRELAAKASFPVFALGLDWIETERRDITIEDNGKDAIMARVAVHLPLWTGPRSAGRREAAALHQAARERRDDRSNLLRSELEELVFRYQDAGRKIALYQDALIPKGNQSLEAAFAAFRSGEGDFLSVLDAERALLEFGLSLERARADRVRARAELDRLTGRPEIGGEE